MKFVDLTNSELAAECKFWGDLDVVTTFELVNCYKVTTEGLKAAIQLLKYPHNFKKLILGNCKVTDEFLLWVKEALPNCTVWT